MEVTIEEDEATIEEVEALTEEVEVTIEVAVDFTAEDTIEANVTLIDTVVTIRMALTNVGALSAEVMEIVVALEVTIETLTGMETIPMDTNVVILITRIKDKVNNKGKVEDIILQIIRDAIKNCYYYLIRCCVNNDTGCLAFLAVVALDFLSGRGHIFHILMVSSPAALATMLPSGDLSRDKTREEWP